MANLPPLVQPLGLNSKQYDAGLKVAVKSIRAFGDHVKQVNTGLVALGGTIGGLAGAAAGLAATFDREMTKVETLVGVNRRLVGEWRQDLLDMAGEVGRGPAELARALFVVTSAGIRSANSIRIVEKAAKLSAIGLGDTATIARALTGIINAYGQANLSAASASNILLGTVREGNFAANELAGTIGRVAAVAELSGVSFAEVGTFIATFTRLGVPVDEAITSLRGFLLILLKMGEQSKSAVRALESIGLSVEDLRKSVREKGLLQTIQDMNTAFKQNPKLIGAVIPRVRALAGVLAQSGAQAEEARVILDRLEGELADTEEAFRRVAETPAQNLAQLRAQVQATLTLIGTEMLPVMSKVLIALTKFAKAIADVARGFNSLPEPVKNLSLAWIALLATLIPIISGVAKVLIPLKAFTTATHGAAAGARVLALGLRSLAIATGVGAAVTVLTVAIGVLLRRRGQNLALQAKEKAAASDEIEFLQRIAARNEDLALTIADLIELRRIQAGIEPEEAVAETAAFRKRLEFSRSIKDLTAEELQAEQNRLDKVIVRRLDLTDGIKAEIAAKEELLRQSTRSRASIDSEIRAENRRRSLEQGKLIVSQEGPRRLRELQRTVLGPLEAEIETLKNRAANIAFGTFEFDPEGLRIPPEAGVSVDELKRRVELVSRRLGEIDVDFGETDIDIGDTEAITESISPLIEAAEQLAEGHFKSAEAARLNTIELIHGAEAALKANQSWELLTNTQFIYGGTLAEAVLNSVRLTEATNDILEAAQKADSEQRRFNNSLDTMLRKLEDEHAALLLSEEGMLRRSLRMNLASREEEDAAVQKLRTIQALTEERETLEAAKEAWDDFIRAKYESKLNIIREAASGLTGALEDFATMSIESFDDVWEGFKSMVENMLGEMQRLAFNMLTAQPVLDAFTNVLGDLTGLPAQAPLAGSQRPRRAGVEQVPEFTEAMDQRLKELSEKFDEPLEVGVINDLPAIDLSRGAEEAMRRAVREALAGLPEEIAAQIRPELGNLESAVSTNTGATNFGATTTLDNTAATRENTIELRPKAKVTVEPIENFAFSQEELARRIGENTVGQTTVLAALNANTTSLGGLTISMDLLKGSVDTNTTAVRLNTAAIRASGGGGGGGGTGNPIIDTITTIGTAYLTGGLSATALPANAGSLEVVGSGPSTPIGGNVAPSGGGGVSPNVAGNVGSAAATQSLGKQLGQIGTGIAISVGIGLLSGLLFGGKKPKEEDKLPPDAPSEPIAASLPELAAMKRRERLGLAKPPRNDTRFFLGFPTAMIPGAGFDQNGAATSREEMGQMIQQAVAEQQRPVINVNNHFEAVDAQGIERVADRMTPRMIKNFTRAMATSRRGQQAAFG